MSSVPGRPVRLRRVLPPSGDAHVTLAWVIGRGGLLGSALSRALARDGTIEFVPDDRFEWGDPAKLHAQIEEAVRGFARAAGDADRWEIHWAAGVGTMMSAEDDLVSETRALAAMIEALGRNPSLAGERGIFSLASSAGAIYAASREPLICESTPVAPTGAYGRAKLEHEAMAARLATGQGVSVFIARISTLYGVGQSGAKAQGLLTHISRCIVRNRAFQIFVPLDTIRDYIAADDAAAMMIEASRHAAAVVTQRGHAHIRIVASEQPATVGEIVAVFKRIARRPPRFVTSATPASSVYTRRIQFRSSVPPLAFSRPKTPLLVGISQLLEAERARYVASSSRT